MNEEKNYKQISDFVSKYTSKGLSQEEVNKLLYPGLIVAIYKITKDGLINENKMKELETTLKEQEVSMDDLGKESVGKNGETLNELVISILTEYIERLDKKLEDL